MSGKGTLTSTRISLTGCRIKRIGVIREKVGDACGAVERNNSTMQQFNNYKKAFE